MMSWFPESWGQVLIPQAPVAELVVRGTVIYWFLFVVLRAGGRRLLGRFAMSDILAMLILAVAVRQGLTGSYDSVGDALISGAVILAWDLAIDEMAFRWGPFQKLLRYPPQTIIREGRLIVENARANLLTRTEVMEKLRDAGVASLDQVRAAYLEPDGSFNVFT